MGVHLRSVPVLGRISAGSPTFAEEFIEGHIIFGASTDSDAPLFALRVIGESMIGAGILDGDYVVVRKQRTARSGEIVAAIVGDEATVKRLVDRRGRLYLEPANRAFRPILIDREDALIQGKVIAVQRNL